MSDTEQWWRSWAPYWDHLEDRHLGTLVTDALSDNLSGPVLVVGSGQGVVVEHLMKKGFEVYGVDREPVMAAHAKRRRGIRTFLADAVRLPFDDNAFGTVIIATGVVDYLFDEALIAAIIAEARRVTRSNGDLLLSFHGLPPRIRRINRRLGVITAAGELKLGRLFDIMHAYETHFLAPVSLIAEWTGKSYLGTFFFWTSLGVTLPRWMREEQKLFVGILKQAREAGVDEAELLGSIPGALPYRDEAEIRQLLRRCGIRQYTLDVYPDCTVVRHHKFAGTEDLSPVPPEKDAPTDWLIRTRHLEKTYRKRHVPAVRDLNITVEKDTIFGILGPNGAGKTTTLSMLCGILSPTGGTIELAGMKRQEVRQQLGYVPQELALYERLTARDNLAFFGKLYGLGGRRLGRRIDALLDMIGLANRADEPVAGFSQGMKRRLNLAAGLVHEPTVILMDEPTVGIDPQSRNRIHDAIFALKRRGATILYTTHYMEEATKLCDRIAIMDNGSVVLCDTPKAAVAKYGCFRMELTFSGGGAGRLLRALRALPAVESAGAADGRLHLVASGRARSTETILEVERTARALGEEVSLSRLSEPNLETLFLDITGRSLRDEEGR